VPTAAYDDIADWYECEFLATQRVAPGQTDFADTLGIDQALVELLGPGRGVCLEVGCGTGIYADRLRGLGWEPVGVDISSGMLAHARGRLPAARGDATELPFMTGGLSTVIAVMVHTDMPQYPSVLAEVRRVLAPGGQFVHIGVHPCFCGGFADRSDREAVVIRPGYLDGRWTTDSWTDQGVRDKVGAVHHPLAELLNDVRSAGFTLDRFAEGAEPTPVTLSFRATRT
jgi:SAM-dependent methyltransferase